MTTRQWWHSGLVWVAVATFAMAFKGIFAHSYVPLRLITLIGVVLSALSVVTTVVMALVWFTIGVPFAGFGTLFSLVVLLFGLLFLMMGIVSEYLGLVYEEVKQRPNFIVRGDIGFNRPADGGQTGDLPR